ncbi:MAG TPA: hypothetical protein VGD56_09125 [Gemmatirosa sp.]
MFGIADARRGALALLLVGIVFFLAGVEQHRSGGSGAFVLIGVVFVLIGVRRLRRITPAFPG